MSFDFIKSKWHIHLSDSVAECIAVQDWLFDQCPELTWASGSGQGGKPERYSLPGRTLTNYKSGSGEVVGRVMHGRSGSFNDERFEIEVSFESVVRVKTVAFPVVETEQQKKLRELEDTIAAATKQIEELKASM